MSDMLARLYEQLKAKREELSQYEAERKELQRKNDDAMYAVHEAAVNLMNHDNEMVSIKAEIKNIQDDIKSLTGP